MNLLRVELCTQLLHLLLLLLQLLLHIVNQLAQGISDVAGQTNYNTQNLLDGSNGTMQVSIGNGSTQLTTNDATLSGIGLTNLNASSASFLSDLDSVIENVNSMRSQGGAEYNGFEHAYNNLTNGRSNTITSYSRKVDQDMGAGMSELKKQQALQQYQMQMQRKKMETQQNHARALFS